MKTSQLLFTANTVTGTWFTHTNHGQAARVANSICGWVDSIEKESQVTGTDLSP